MSSNNKGKFYFSEEEKRRKKREECDGIDFKFFAKIGKEIVEYTNFFRLGEKPKNLPNDAKFLGEGEKEYYEKIEPEYV